MSKVSERLAQTVEMLELMNQSPMHLRTELLPKISPLFALLAEEPLEEARQLQAEIEQHTAKLR